MSRIVDLIAELCPEGVEFARLGELVRIRNGRDYKALGLGDIPVYGTGGVMLYVDAAAHPGPSVLIPRKGSLGKLYYVDKPFWTVDTIFYTEIGDRLDPKFLYYHLSTQRLEELNQAAGIPSLTQSVLNLLLVPVPPLEVQREIVRVLDQFTRLEANLEAELEARRRQYAHYRYSLLEASDDVPRVLLGDLFDMRSGRFVSAADISPELDFGHSFPCYGGNGLRGYVATPNQDGRRVLVGRQGALSGNVHRVDGEFYATEHAIVVTPLLGVEIDIDWAFHMLTAMNLNQYISQGAQPGLTVGTLKELSVPVPPLEKQERISSKLNAFDALVNDLSVGLPAELAARRKQYEHYRDRILTFEKAMP